MMDFGVDLMMFVDRRREPFLEKFVMDGGRVKVWSWSWSWSWGPKLVNVFLGVASVMQL